MSDVFKINVLISNALGLTKNNKMCVIGAQLSSHYASHLYLK